MRAARSEVQLPVSQLDVRRLVEWQPGALADQAIVHKHSQFLLILVRYFPVHPIKDLVEESHSTVPISR